MLVVQGEKRPFSNHKIGQRELDMQLSRVRLQSVVIHRAMGKQVLDEVGGRPARDGNADFHRFGTTQEKATSLSY